MVSPCLPHDDPNTHARSEQLAKNREIYRYSYAWPPGIAVAAEVPKSDTYSIPYLARIMGITAGIVTNALPLADLFVSPDRAKPLLTDVVERMKGAEPREIGERFFQVQVDVARQFSSERPSSVENYGRFYNSIAAPPAHAAWDDDRSFAWQRIAGANPMVLSRIEALPDHVAVGEREYARAIGGGSLAAALAAGRVFACDYGFLAGAPPGTTNGHRKWLPAPYAVFAAVSGALRPVAIQAGPNRDSPVYTPGDGHGWRLAKLAVQVADASHHELYAHLGRTHLVMEAVALATHRQLANDHPLSVLLRPHVEFTLPINHSAATSLIAPGGAIDLIFGATIESMAGLVKKGLDALDLPASAIPSDLARRGLADPEILPEHPYRDDGLLVWGAIRRFAEAYVRRYYASDAAVLADHELAAWTTELGSREGGRLHGLRRLETVEALAELVGIVIWTGSAQHAAVNFPQFPFMSSMPNMVGALWAEWPGPGVADDEATHLRVLPPNDIAWLQFATVYQLSSLRINRLGHYPTWHFHDAQARALVEAFNADLAQAEEVIAARDGARFMPYPFLLPSAIPASIHI